MVYVELQCSRKHYFRYEMGLTRDSIGLALRVGSAWSRAMESRWKGETYLKALKSRRRREGNRTG